MPDISFPSITVRVSYTGVGPLEMEELITRPIEQAVSAVAGLDQINSTSSEGNSTVRLNFTWGTDLNEAADEVRTRIDRVRGRLPEDADPPTIFKFDSTSFPIMGIGVEGNFDAVTLREMAQNDLSPRLERVAGVAAVSVDGGLRRQIRVDLSREKITALNLSVDRVVNVLRTENQNIPLGEVFEGSRMLLLRSPGQFTDIDEIRNLAVMTQNGVPVYMRDIADVRDTTEDRRQFTRINGKPGIRMRVTKQSGTNTVQIAEGVRAEIARINREVPGVTLSVLDDQSIFIDRSIGSVREHALLGSLLVILVIFAFLRDWRATIIICTSIPISVIGTFALLYFGGYTLNTLTFGGLALGIGMIVDAAIVVLENTHRHLEMGKDRMTAAIDGAEEVWSAILASTLTHIAVFVPMLFLTGVSSIMFGQLAAVVSFSLAMSLFVAVTIVPVLCSRLLTLPPPAAERRGLTAGLFRAGERVLDGIDHAYARLLHLSLHHRPTVFAVGIAAFVAALVLLPRVGFEFQPTTDEGEVTVDAELAVGTRLEVTEAALIGLEETIRETTPEAMMLITQAGGGGGGGGGFGNQQTNRGSITVRLVPKDERQRTSEQIAMDLRRRLSGLPGRDHPRPRLRRPADAHAGRRRRRRQPPLGRGPRPRPRRVGAAGPRPEVDSRHHARDRRLAARPRRGPARAGRPRRSRQGGDARHDRHRRRRDHPHQRRRHPGGVLPRGGQRVSDRRPAARGGPRGSRRRSATCCSASPAAGSCRPRTSWSSTATPARRRSTARTRSASCASTPRPR